MKLFGISFSETEVMTAEKYTNKTHKYHISKIEIM